MENERDVLNNLVLCSTALDICKETALLSLKGRADQIIKTLRTPIVTSVPEIPNRYVQSVLHFPNATCHNSDQLFVHTFSQQHVKNTRFVRIPEYHKQATKLCSDVMNCLAWEFTLALYPSFETSKDYTILHSYILNQDEESSEIKNRIFRSREGSLNELIRTKKLPSSLTVHRRAKVDIVTSSTTKVSTDSFSVIKFDTSVNEYNSQRTKTVQFVTKSITEDECSTASIQVSGDVSQFDMAHEGSLDIKDGLDNADGLNALVPFFLPTGKAVIPYVGTNRHVAQNFHPTPKLYSMVLKARDQTTIYACSLVLYRPVLLVEDVSGTFADWRTGDGVGSPKLDELDDAANKKVGNPLGEGDTPKPIDTCASADSNSAVVPQQGATTARAKVSMTMREVKLSTIPAAGFEHMGPSRAEQVCSERSITNDSATFIIPTLKELKLKLPAVIQTSSSGPTDAVFVSEMTATTPALISLLSCSPRDVLSPIGILSPVVISTAADEKLSSAFSDDESAGLSSSVLSHDRQIPSGNTATHIHKKPAVGVMKLYPQGVFTDFLSATANATASVASAIALQAGSLPSYINASKSSEQKGFYDFSRFKTMNFATNTPVQFENASKLKRKYEGIAVLDPSVTDVDTSLSVDFNSLRLSASSRPFSPTTLDKNLSSQWNFSPEKTMSSYPRFGAAKSTRNKTTSPRTPSWSPGQTTASHNHNRKMRSHVQGNARIPFARNLNRDVLGSISSSETHSTTHFDCARTLNSLETNPRGQTAAMHGPDVGSNLATKSGSAELAPPLSRRTNGEDFPAEKEVKGVAYVAYGFALLTDVPMIGRLREAASNAASNFVNAHNPLNIGVSSVLQDKNTLSHLIAKYARPSLKVEEDPNATSSPIATLSHDSDPDLTMYSTSISAEQSGDYDSSIVFDALSPKNLVTVLIAFLLEYRIVAVSSRTLSASTHLGEWLKDAIYPLKYAHVYSPLVPPCIGLQLIHCPAPFFIGMKRTSKIDEVVESEDERDREKIKGRRGKTAGSKDSTCGLLLVDLDRDECSMPQDLCLLVKSARFLIRALEDLLYPQLCCCDEVIGIEKESTGPVKGYQARNLCRKFVRSLLEGSKRSCLRAEDGDEHIVIFDEVLFMQQHLTRLSLHPTIVAKSNQSEKQNIAEAEYTIVDEVRFDGTSLLPVTVSGGKDIEKLLRSLIITQCFSLYLTS